ncbi:MAG: prephenate dehydrogenase [Candidatus Omnitrophica bacterium]|nr:prephenate dehydrogenase [Candidatus Omnitrophota bacterium]
MKLKKIVIIGTGLIGGSIGKAVLSKKMADEVIGISRRRSSLRRALREKCITSGYINNYAKACRGADVIFIATPVNTIKDVIVKLSKTLKDKNVIVTDAGSTKKEIVDRADKYKNRFSFVGAHPLAGLEKTGVEYSRPDLFKNSVCVLTRSVTTDRKKLQEVKKLWEAFGATTRVVTPDIHDKILSLTSHLPHVVAFALAGVLEKKYCDYVAGGFKDTTRIAASDPILWSDIFISNRKNLKTALGKFRKNIADIERSLASKQAARLIKKLKECKRKRDNVVF